ncbi:MAG TPA: SRPBCC domain-containing protein, partial [Terriglobales bacterium]
MANRAIIPEQDSITYEIDIAAPPERVFRALTDPAEARQWGNSPQFQMKIWEMDAQLGGKWRFLCKETNGKANKYGVDEYDHWGEIVEIDPPKLLAYTWITNFHDDPKHKTVVRWDLTPIPQGTRLKVTHSGLAHEPKARSDYSQGWPGLLHVIKTHAEKLDASKSAVLTSVTFDQDAVVSETDIAAPPE